MPTYAIFIILHPLKLDYSDRCFRAYYTRIPHDHNPTRKCNNIYCLHFTAILNPHTLQRPNVMQSSPSPTSIITNINQSNFLCSQAPEPTTATTQILAYKDSTVFQHPGSNHGRRDARTPQFKQVVIVQTQSSAQDADSDCRPKCQGIGNARESSKQENYNFKNLAINNYIQDFSNTQESYQNLDRSEIYQSEVKNNFGLVKPKFYIPFADKRNERPHSEATEDFVPVNKDYNIEPKSEMNKEKRDEKKSCPGYVSDEKNDDKHN
jgi:hypothetical protein